MPYVRKMVFLNSDLLMTIYPIDYLNLKYPEKD